MKLGIMQPYFFPYLGYFQLVNAVEKFVIYDNIQFSKKGWINRNRILANGKDFLFTINLKKDSDYLNVCERYISPAYKKESEKFLRQVQNSYKKAPSFCEIMPLIIEIIKSDVDNLFDFILNSIRKINEYLDITTPLIISSSIDVSSDFKGQDRVIETCKKLNASEYINPIGGVELYSKDIFKDNSLELSFIEMDNITYPQNKDEFISHLSIIDVLMWNSKEEVQTMLTQFKIRLCL